MGSANLRFASVVVLLSSWSSVASGQSPSPPAQQPPPASPPAAQPSPPPPPAQAYPPAPGTQGQAYPPPAQPYPYPPPTYPTPPQSYPPGQSYPPQNYPPQSYPPPAAPVYAPPAAPVAPRYPEDASTQASPFFDAILLGVAADERFSDALMFGGQVGGYVGGWLRLSARLAVPTDPSDNSGYDDVLINYSEQIDTPSIMYGASLGVVVARRTKFVFSPGITLNRTDVGDYGTLFGASMPFEWVMRGGTRFGFEVAFGRGLGGEVKYECSAVNCVSDVSRDRDPGVFFMIGLNIGFGLGYPDPQAPSAK